jgi:hypothetical protein
VRRRVATQSLCENRLMRRFIVVSLLVPTALFVSSCGGDDAANTGDQSVVSTESPIASPTDAPNPPTSTAGKDTPASGTPATESLYLEVDLEDDAPVDASVVVGSPVTIIVTSDDEHEYHLHGYDIELAGDEVTFEFVADELGTFELETHDTSEVVVNLEVIAE